ncbi:hypothetical protein [Massilia sp. Leaf139]|uniref:hypothetical protein n=1 Tax=Massilia sp. Leaf139 TaxID=1736272 RepID=UPI0006F387E7|nr:hypothetical protein [Massilia sp. Leaf139]KQQ87897.1 hypothetical protein ASF77_14280 [Massilia sp. Leaf139]
MSQNPAFDSSIPVLTEVVLEPAALTPAEAEPAAPQEAAALLPTEDQAQKLADRQAEQDAKADTEPALQPLPEPDWDELERRIAERVVAQLQPQIDAVVRNALASAADQIHVGLRQAVEQVVAQQVAALQFGQKT